MAAVLPLSGMSAGLSGTTTPSYEFHSSRSRESFSSGSSQASPPATGHSMISPFPFESSVFSSRGISPVPEEGALRKSDTPVGDHFSSGIESTIVIMGLPRPISDRELRSIFIFAKDFINVELIPDSPHDEDRLPPPKRSAVARFRSFQAAQEAKDHINSKKTEIFEGEVLQATLPISQPQTFISSRRNTTDNNSRPALLSSSNASSTASSMGLAAKSRGLGSAFLSNEAIVPAAGLIGTIPPSLVSSGSGLGGLGSLSSTTSFGSEYTSSLGPSPEYITDAFNSLSVRTPGSIGPSSGKALLIEEAENEDAYENLLNSSQYLYSNSSALATEPPAMKQRRATTNNPPTAIPARGFGPLSLNTNNLPPLNGPMLGSPATMLPGNASTLTSPISIPMSSTSAAPNSAILPPYQRVLPAANPADQNPPCNTLYVGNLPANTSEDELKALFSRQRGYKRLCFRTKANGPMCFVEFEDVAYATRALTELYGRGLSNSVKGGIRLSFSKNPLGVRSNQNASNLQSPTTPSGGAPGGGSGGIFSTALHAPPGLSHPGVTPTSVRPNPLETAPPPIAPLASAISPRDPGFGAPGGLMYRESLLSSPVGYPSTTTSALGFTPVTTASSSSAFTASVGPPNIPGFLVGK